jgi:hypothetical protein
MKENQKYMKVAVFGLVSFIGLLLAGSGCMVTPPPSDFQAVVDGANTDESTISGNLDFVLENNQLSVKGFVENIGSPGPFDVIIREGNVKKHYVQPGIAVFGLPYVVETEDEIRYRVKMDTVRELSGEQVEKLTSGAYYIDVSYFLRSVLGAILQEGQKLPPGGNLQINISGLPVGIKAKVFLRGAFDNTIKSVLPQPATETTLFADIFADFYEVTTACLNELKDDGSKVPFDPNPVSSPVLVNISDTTTVEVVYAESTTECFD